MFSESTQLPASGRPRDFWQILNIPSRGAALHEALEQGFSTDILAELSQLSGLSRERLGSALEFAPATVQRRLKAGRFNREESDRLFRLIKLMSEATRLFEGDIEAARAWMNREVKGLGHRRPVEMMATSAEADEVFALIGRLEHGVVS